MAPLHLPVRTLVVSPWATFRPALRSAGASAMPVPCSRRGVLPHAADRAGLDGYQQAGLVAASVPGIRATQVTLSQRLDVFGRTVSGHVDDASPDLEIP